MIVLQVRPGLESASALDAVKALAWSHPGDHQLTLRVQTPSVTHRLHLGPAWTYDASRECVAALEEFGTVEVVA